MPLPPPTEQPPPPPSIKDIPQRATPQHQIKQQSLPTNQQHLICKHNQLMQQRHHHFGPQNRGNYSDVENFTRGHNLEHDNVRRQYSDSETCFSCSHGPNHYSGDGSDCEPHYSLQTPDGNILIPQSQSKFTLVLRLLYHGKQRHPCLVKCL